MLGSLFGGSTPQALLRSIAQVPKSVKFEECFLLGKFEKSGKKGWIGRDGGAVDYCLDSKRVRNMISRKHASVQHVNGTWVVKDENSTNGMFVNDIRTKKATLNDNDIIVFGGGRGVKVGAKKTQNDSEFMFRFEALGTPDNASIASRFTSAIVGTKSRASGSTAATQNYASDDEGSDVAKNTLIGGTQAFIEEETSALGATQAFAEDNRSTIGGTQAFHEVSQNAKRIDEDIGGTQEFYEDSIGDGESKENRMLIQKLTDRVRSLEQEVRQLRKLVSNQRNSVSEPDDSSKSNLKRTSDKRDGARRSKRQKK
ncbi:hypothetical protein AAMO2058_000265600 [Amorphochlora amoebiformis]